MKKIIRLTESDLTRLVRRVINENQREEFSDKVKDKLRIRTIYQKIIKYVRNGDIQRQEFHDFKKLKEYAEREASKMGTFITDDEIEYDLSPLFFGNTEVTDYESPESDWRY
jgi:DNA-directed RNA polymerase beta' subunit